VEEGHAFFVVWTCARLKQARRVSLDDQQRIKTIVAFAVRVETFAECHVLVNRVGLYMKRRTAPVRDPMPKWCLDRQRHEHLQSWSGPFEPLSLPVAYRSCVVCAAAKDTGGQLAYSEPAPDAVLCLCKSCHTPWHKSCAEFFSTHTQACGSGGGARVVEDNFVCPSCSAGP
jgi:hypothetical protein